MKRVKKTLLVVGLLGGMVAFGASPALAVSAKSPDGGAYVSASGKKMWVEDTKTDNHSVYGYANNKDYRLNNTGGSGSTASRTYAFNVSTVMACTNVQIGSDPCSAWSTNRTVSALPQD